MKTSTASANGNQDITSITITLAGASPDVTAALIQIELQGTPAATTYPNGNTPVYAATVTRIVNGSPSLWVVSQQSKTGALTLSFSNVQAVQGVTAQGTNSAQTLTQYNIHGTAQATLIAPPTPSAPGTSTVAAPLTMAVTF
jgi:hypothetical protein